MVETLASKIVAWEKERGTGFTYDGVRIRHLTIYKLSLGFCEI